MVAQRHHASHAHPLSRGMNAPTTRVWATPRLKCIGAVAVVTWLATLGYYTYSDFLENSDHENYADSPGAPSYDDEARAMDLQHGGKSGGARRPADDSESFASYLLHSAGSSATDHADLVAVVDEQLRGDPNLPDFPLPQFWLPDEGQDLDTIGSQ